MRARRAAPGILIKCPLSIPNAFPHPPVGRTARTAGRHADGWGTALGILEIYGLLTALRTRYLTHPPLAWLTVNPPGAHATYFKMGRF